MTTLSDLLATPIMQTLGLTLVHFLWQGTLVALVIAVLLYVLKDSSATARYLISCAGLAVMILFPLVTFAYLAPNIKPVYQFTDLPEPALQAANIQSSANTTTPQTTTPASDTAANPTEVTPTQNQHVSRTLFSPKAPDSPRASPQLDHFLADKINKLSLCKGSDNNAANLSS